MSERRSKGKRLIPIPESLLRGLMKASSKEGKTLNGYIAESLQQAVKVSDGGQNLSDIVYYFEILQSQKASGAIFTPLTVFDFITKKVYSTDKKKLLDIWFDSGEWYGKYIKEKFQKPVKAFADLLRSARWDLNEVDVKETNGSLKLNCTSTSQTKESTELLLNFILGSLEGMNYKILNNEFMKGLILIEFTLCT
jgi:hypothetical protein